MYFNPQVKEQLKDFYNLEILRGKLKEAINHEAFPLIAVHGLRRTGKTSLIKVILNSQKKKYVWLDGREIISRDDFNRKLSEEADKHKKIRVDKISFRGVELSLRAKSDWNFLNKHKIALVIDETQLLKRFRLDNIIAHIYDNYPKIKIILSGSETGMLLNFLGTNNARAPLYGRAIYEIQTNRLTPESSRTFLIEGAKQVGKIFKNEEIIEVIDKIDGIIGWLTKYGWYRLKLSHSDALNKTIEEGKEVAKQEFLKFAVRAEGRYKAIVKTLKGGARWEILIRRIGISAPQLNLMLKRLIDHGFVEKQDKLYRIADPLLEAAF